MRAEPERLQTELRDGLSDDQNLRLDALESAMELLLVYQQVIGVRLLQPRPTFIRDKLPGRNEEDPVLDAVEQ